MKATRIISLLLVLATLLSVFVACDDENDGLSGGGDRVNGSWENVDFEGATVNFALSVAQYPEMECPAASLYTKGPDKADSNEVTKEVLARNARAVEELNININYVPVNLTYDLVQEDLRNIVQTAAEDSPDIYNNDIYGLARCMVNGLLWNVKNPGENVKNYFDFEAKGWYTDFIKGCTFDQNRYYLFAGEYFIDVLRYAWMIFVNNDLLKDHKQKFPSWCSSPTEFYGYVRDGFWDFDMMETFVEAFFTDGGLLGTTEKTDPFIGLAYNHMSDWAMGPSTGVSRYYLDENYNPKSLETIDTFQKVANGYQSLMSTLGSYYTEQVVDSTATFIGGNVLFLTARLGEMEAPTLRDISWDKGVAPLPKWDADQQDKYITVSHDQTEIGCIPSSAGNFTGASALMQYLNENSEQVLYTYFEKGLKYKYNDNKDARDMMDIIRGSISNPFGAMIGQLCETTYTGTGYLFGVTVETTNMPSLFASEKDVYKQCLANMVAKFQTFAT